jgi:hypothetical protein
MENKQTALEFLQESLYAHLSHEQMSQFEGLFNQALAIERFQIEQAAIWMPDHFGTEFIPELGKQYYEQKYRQTKL